jgi:hypothetical protein
MTKRDMAIALCALTITAGFAWVAPAAAVEGHDCTGSPADAVMNLPLPLSKWGHIACTPYGHMLTSRDGWVWVMPNALEPVLVPSQAPDRQPELLGNASYFTRIDVAKVRGEEFDDVYKTFHVGFDENEVKPDAYRADIATAAGKSIRMYFFDYDTYAWGMSCPDNKCETDSRFMILDKNTRPKARAPAI